MFFSKKLSIFENIKHCFFSKKNGFSKGIYKSLNCGPGSNDDKINIKKNLGLVIKKMDLKNDNLIFMNQTHSNKVIVVNDENKGQKKFNSDALITRGLLAFLIQGLSNLTPAEVIAIKPDFIKATGLHGSLTASRANGFLNIFLAMQKQATALTKNI